MRRIMRPSADDAGQPAAERGRRAGPRPRSASRTPARTRSPARPRPQRRAQPAEGAGGAAAPRAGGRGARRGAGRRRRRDGEPRVLPAVEPQAEGEQPRRGRAAADATAAIPAGRPRRGAASSAAAKADAPFDAASASRSRAGRRGRGRAARSPTVPRGSIPPRPSCARPAGRRGRLRRRLRYLRRARELMLRDLGGLVFEIHRTGGGGHGLARADRRRQGRPASASSTRSPSRSRPRSAPRAARPSSSSPASAAPASSAASSTRARAKLLRGVRHVDHASRRVTEGRAPVAGTSAASRAAARSAR